MLTPTLRYHPSIIAQAFGTLGVLYPGRVFLGVGTGESLNETPATGGEWPSGKERRLRLTEAIELIRRLWTEERVDFDGEYYQTQHATIYDRPDSPVPIYVAASGPLAAKLAGRVGDGFICTSGKGPSSTSSSPPASRRALRRPAATPARSRHMIEIKVSYDSEPSRAARLRLVGGAGADAGREDRRRGSDRDGARSPTTPSTAPTRGSSSPTIPTRSSRRSRRT